MNAKTLSDLQPGDHFIEKLFVNDVIVFIYSDCQKHFPK